MQSLQKDEEQTRKEEIILKLSSLVSQDELARFTSNLVCRFT